MEKSTPHCKLPIVKSLVKAGKVKATASAYEGARALGVNDLEGMCAIVLSLTLDNFYKSMTTHQPFQHNRHPAKSGDWRGMTCTSNSRSWMTC